MPLITMAEYARSRKKRGLPGGTKAGVKKAVDSGRVTLVDGKIDPARADRQWGERTNQMQQRPAKKSGRKSAEIQDHRPGKRETLAEARTRKEIALANLREKEDRERDGELIPADVVKSEWADIGARIQNAVMGLRAAACNRLPAEWRPDVSGVLDEEIRRILAALSDEIRCGTAAA